MSTLGQKHKTKVGSLFSEWTFFWASKMSKVANLDEVFKMGFFEKCKNAKQAVPHHIW
jgi:hypothetical protein